MRKLQQAELEVRDADLAVRSRGWGVAWDDVQGTAPYTVWGNIGDNVQDNVQAAVWDSVWSHIWIAGADIILWEE